MTKFELFFKQIGQLRDTLQFLDLHGIHNVNIPNKKELKGSFLLESLSLIHQEFPHMKMIPHFSGCYQYNRRVPSSILDMKEFMFHAEKCGVQEVLIVSGGQSKKNFGSVDILQSLAEWDKRPATLEFGVAYNPYLPVEEMAMEREKLHKKLSSGLVSSIWLQFGTDLESLSQELNFLKGFNKRIIGSVFRPTKTFLNQFKFRPWKGVFCSEQYLNSIEFAEDFTRQLTTLYKSNDVEILLESAITNEKDLDHCKTLLNLSPSKQEQQEIKALSVDDIEPKEEGDAKSPTKVALLPSSKNTAKLGIDSKPVSLKRKENKKKIPSKIGIVLYRTNDLRVNDHPALASACSTCDEVIPLFLWAPDGRPEGVSPLASGEWQDLRAGASEVWISCSVVALKESLIGLGGDLVERRASLSPDGALQVIMDLVTRSLSEYSGYSHVKPEIEFFAGIRFEPEARAADRMLQGLLQQQGIKTHFFNTCLMYDPEVVGQSMKKSNAWSGHWGTLMPYVVACRSLGPPPRPVDAPKSVLLPSFLDGDIDPTIQKLTFHPWMEPLLESWDVTERAAARLMESFLKEGLAKYEKERSRVDKESSVTRLSPYLRHGNLSPRTLHWAVIDENLPRDLTKTFGRRLYWRELAYFQLTCFPLLHSVGIRKHYDLTRWNNDEATFKVWCKGNTGFPMVDSGMRELWHTGWMHQSVRMVVASFLVEYLGIDWRKGLKWFHDTLVDCDMAINSMMWQNAGKSGADQWNFVIKPDEGRGRDPSGRYVRKWVPELKKLPDKYIFTPWLAPKSVLAESGVSLGSPLKIVGKRTYPLPIVESLTMARELNRLETVRMRRSCLQFNDGQGYDLVKLPDGTTTRLFTKREYRLKGNGDYLMPEVLKSSQYSTPDHSRTDFRPVFNDSGEMVTTERDDDGVDGKILKKRSNTAGQEGGRKKPLGTKNLLMERSEDVAVVAETGVGKKGMGGRRKRGGGSRVQHL